MKIKDFGIEKKEKKSDIPSLLPYALGDRGQPGAVWEEIMQGRNSWDSWAILEAGYHNWHKFLILHLKLGTLEKPWV